jgi:hypothetical protein
VNASAPKANINGSSSAVTQVPGGFSMGHPPMGTGPQTISVTDIARDKKPTNANAELKVPIPDDLILEIRSSHGALIVNGKKTNNLRHATALRREPLCEAIRALLGCFEAHGLAPTSKEIDDEAARRVDLNLWIGSVHLKQGLNWDASHGEHLRSLIGNPYSSFYDMLQTDLVHQIKLAGPHLFLFNSQAPEVR